MRGRDAERDEVAVPREFTGMCDGCPKPRLVFDEMVGRQNQQPSVVSVLFQGAESGHRRGGRGVPAAWLEKESFFEPVRASRELVLREKVMLPIGDGIDSLDVIQRAGALDRLLEQGLAVGESDERFREGFSGDRPQARTGTA
jgi:hypothetical protein